MTYFYVLPSISKLSFLLRAEFVFPGGRFFAQDSRKILVIVGNTASHLSTKPAVAELTAPSYLLSEVKTREKDRFRSSADHYLCFPWIFFWIQYTLCCLAHTS
jgi:hypothetical protein